MLDARTAMLYTGREHLLPALPERPDGLPKLRRTDGVNEHGRCVYFGTHHGASVAVEYITSDWGDSGWRWHINEDTQTELMATRKDCLASLKRNLAVRDARGVVKPEHR